MAMAMAADSSWAFSNRRSRKTKARIETLLGAETVKS